MILRASETGDLAPIQAICAHRVRTGVSSFEIDPPDLDEVAGRRDAVLEKGLPFLPADIENGRTVGNAYAALDRPGAACPGSRWRIRFTSRLSIRAVALAAGDRGLHTAGFRQMIAVVGGPEENAVSVPLHN